MTTVLEKSTGRPLASFAEPSSMMDKKRFKILGDIFSTSSIRMTLSGFHGMGDGGVVADEVGAQDLLDVLEPLLRIFLQAVDRGAQLHHGRGDVVLVHVGPEGLAELLMEPGEVLQRGRKYGKQVLL